MYAESVSESESISKSKKIGVVPNPKKNWPELILLINLLEEKYN
jgi:hypothetical protein